MGSSVTAYLSAQGSGGGHAVRLQPAVGDDDYADCTLAQSWAPTSTSWPLAKRIKKATCTHASNLSRRRTSPESSSSSVLPSPPRAFSARV